MKFSGENFQKLFLEDQSETGMSEKWQSVVRQSVRKCETESKIERVSQTTILKISFLDPASDKPDAAGCNLQFVDGIAACCFAENFLNCPNFDASSECVKMKANIEECLKGGNNATILHLLAGKPKKN